MTWQLHCKMAFKRIHVDGQKTYSFSAVSSRMSGEHTSIEFDSKEAIVGVYNVKFGRDLIADLGWSSDEVFRRYGTDHVCQDTSWISYYPDIDQVNVAVILSDEKLAFLHDDFSRLLHGSTALMQLTLTQASFSQTEGNPFTRRPTKDSFLKGEPLLTEDDFRFAFVPGEFQ